MERNKWEDTNFTEKIRITKSDLEYIRKSKGKKSLAGKLKEIISAYKKDKTEGVCN
jgi:hypothetical protein